MLLSITDKLATRAHERLYEPDASLFCNSPSPSSPSRSRTARTIIRLTQRGSLTPFFHPTSLAVARSIHRSRRPNNAPPSSIYLCIPYILYACTCVLIVHVRVRRECVWRETRFRREKQHRSERGGPKERKKENSFSLFLLLLLSPSLPLSILLFLARTCEYYTRERRARRGSGCERREFPVVNVFGMHLPQPLKPEPRARARRVPIKAPRTKVTALFP